jgi:hypothetical protein
MLNFVFVAFSIGFLVPFLISSPSDLGVIAGAAYLLFVVPVVLYYVNRKYIMNIVEKL